MSVSIISTLLVTLLLLHSSQATVSKALDTRKHSIRQPASSLDTSLLDNSTLFNIHDLNARTEDKFTSNLLSDKLDIATSELNFNNQTYDDLVIQFGRRSVVWSLVKFDNNNESDNLVFTSENHGKSFRPYTKFAEFKLDSIEIDDMFVSTQNREFLIFSDTSNKALFISSSNGEYLSHYRISFQPYEFYFTRDSDIFLAFDKENSQLWLTTNMGRTWKLICEHLTKFSEAVPVDSQSIQHIYFLEADSNAKQSLVRFDLDGFREDFINENVAEHKHTIASDINDFAVIGDLVFLMKQSEEHGLELSMSRNNSDFKTAGFELQDNSVQILDFQVTLVTDSEIFVVATYKLNNQIKNELFRSEINSDSFMFKSSLTNIVNKCQVSRKLNQIQLPNELNNNRCIEMRSLKKDVYLANAMNKMGKVETFLKKSGHLNWTPIEFDTLENEDLALNLNQNFFQMHLQPEGSFGGGENLPDAIFATVNQNEVYMSYDDGIDWSPVEFGNNNTYEYSISDKVIIAVAANKPVNKFLYSLDFGYNWNEYFFSSKLVFVSEIVRDPSEDSSVFYLACTHAGNKQALLRVDFLPQQLGNFQNENEYDAPKPIPFDPSQLVTTPATVATTSVLAVIAKITTTESMKNLAWPEEPTMPEKSSMLEEPTTPKEPTSSQLHFDYSGLLSNDNSLLKLSLLLIVLTFTMSFLIVVWYFVKKNTVPYDPKKSSDEQFLIDKQSQENIV